MCLARRRISPLMLRIWLQPSGAWYTRSILRPRITNSNVKKVRKKYSLRKNDTDIRNRHPDTSNILMKNLLNSDLVVTAINTQN